MVLVISRVKVERPLMMKWQLGRQKPLRNIAIGVVQILKILMNMKNQVDSTSVLKNPSEFFTKPFFYGVKNTSVI